MLIVVDSTIGCIGAGKTTFAKKLSEKISKSIFYPEIILHDYLPAMYADIAAGVKPSMAATVMQYKALNTRYLQAVEAGKLVWAGKTVVMDRYFFSDLGFAATLWKSGFISGKDFFTYQEVFKTLNQFIIQPHLLIDLHLDVEGCIKRINLRMQEIEGRQCETSITREYLHRLSKSFKEYVVPCYKPLVIFYVVNDSSFEELEEIEEILKFIEKANV